MSRIIVMYEYAGPFKGEQYCTLIWSEELDEQELTQIVIIL